MTVSPRITVIVSALIRTSTLVPIKRLGTEYVLARMLIVELLLTRMPLRTSSVSSR
jgi:hypothetical protein